jgi:hypothetical protein
VFVNRRHVDYPKVFCLSINWSAPFTFHCQICRVANEVYGQYNRGQHCILVLFVDIPPSKLDVNVSPDKRTVFVHHEKEVFAYSLLNFYVFMCVFYSFSQKYALHYWPHSPKFLEFAQLQLLRIRGRKVKFLRFFTGGTR